MLRQCVPFAFTFARAACAATSGVSMAPAGMEAKVRQLRVRKGRFPSSLEPRHQVGPRSQHGAAELSAGADGTYSGDNFLMRTSGPGGVSLAHDGKVLGSKCKKA